MGPGKSTTLKAMLDVVRRDSGTVEILGLNLDTDQPRIKEQIGVVWGESHFHEFLNGIQVSHMLGRIYRNWDQELFLDYLHRFALPGKKKIKEYSKGMQMKLSIAAALSHHPRLLVLDEATSGLDPVVRDEILDILFGFIEDGGNSVLISSHITSDLDKVADYITMIHNGSILFSEEKDSLIEDMGIIKCSQEELEHLKDMAGRGGITMVGIRKAHTSQSAWCATAGK